MDEMRATGPGWRVWVEAARPRTLPASIVPVLVGTAASERARTTWHDLDHLALDVAGLGLVWSRFALALVVALALQVAVNFANDLFDAVKGVDTEARVGPRRVTASGLVSPGRMKVATGVALAVAGAAGLALSLAVDPRLLLVGVAAGLATLGYSGGPRPYASAGLGEVFVFVFFGLVATLGSLYVQDEQVTLVGLLCGVAMGLWSVALLLVNNLRDIPTDREVGKRTLAVRIGESSTRALYVACVLGAYLVVLALLPVTAEPWPALALLSLPVVGPGLRVVRHDPIGPGLIAALGHTARAQLSFGILLAVGLLPIPPTVAQVVDVVA